jgi:hypothetical protein
MLAMPRREKPAQNMADLPAGGALSKPRGFR